jgi:uncharacterized protein involved in exopolysaccharide biosynthesis
MSMVDNRSDNVPAPERAAGAAAISAADLLAVLMAHWKLLVILPLTAAVLLAGFAYTRTPRYTTSASFLPEADGERSSPLSGLAAQFGVRVPTSTPASSPEYYAELLTSREVLRRTVQTEYALYDEPGAAPATLDVLYGMTRGSPEERLERSIDRLRHDIGVSTGRQTGLVRLTVSAESPFLAQAISVRLLELLNEFNLHTRQTQAAAERRFIEVRMDSAAAELRQAEERVESFLVQNRRFDHSPELSFEHERLSRQIGMRQALYTSLAEAFEETRIREVRSSPSFTVVDPPYRPVRPAGRGTITSLLLGLVIGFILALSFVIGREFLRRALMQDPHAYQRLLEARNGGRSGRLAAPSAVGHPDGSE